MKAIEDPFVEADIVAANRVEAVTLDGGQATITLAVDPERAVSYQGVRMAVEMAAQGVDGVSKATVVLTAHTDQPKPAQRNAPSEPPPNLSSTRRGPPTPVPISGVVRVIAVGSGKGGVGKSTVAANLAIAMAEEGWRVGLLDSDIHGPSQPRMMGLADAEPLATLPLKPLEAFGVKVMSIGFIVPAEDAVVWRGPMLMKAMTQLLHQCEWGELDALIVDLPPGTGDVQISLAQRAPVTGAVIISTPQDIALLDARKAVKMFEKLDAPVLGVVENMSTHICSACGHEEPIFGHGGAQAEAKKIGAPFLGALPLELATRLSGDAGAPIVASDPSSAQADRFRAVARALIASIKRDETTLAIEQRD